MGAIVYGKNIYILHIIQWIKLSLNRWHDKRLIEGTKILAEIKRMLSMDKDKTWKTDKNNKEHKTTKLLQTKLNEPFGLH